MQKHVIIVAGGSGQRMQQALPKQFIKVGGKPIIVHTVEAFLKYQSQIHVVVVLPKAHFETWETIQDEFLPNTLVTLAEGGNSRFQSVASGLSKVENGLVAIHDAVRPLVSTEVIHRSFESAQTYGSGVAMVPLKDSIRMQNGDDTIARDRNHYFAVQTPQTFQVELIQTAFKQTEQPAFTDDASVFEAHGMQVQQVMGDYRNLKVTTPEDLIVAEALLAATT